MQLRDIQGLRYPDEFVTRFFFKYGLSRNTGSVLELGCGNGNNLSLFYQFGWRVVGVDSNYVCIEEGNRIFQNLSKDSQTSGYELKAGDMVDFLESGVYPPFNALILASSIYYLKYERIIQLFRLLRERNFLEKGAKVYIRVRKDDDFRFGKGIQTSAKSYKIDFPETGERNCEVIFFGMDEFAEILNEHLPLANVQRMNLRFDDYQAPLMIDNSDMIFWGEYLK